MVNNNQRIGSVSNAHVGKDFETDASNYFRLEERVDLQKNYAKEIGHRSKKLHRFDLGADNPAMLVECKSHTWTQSDRVPSAKMTTWDQAMLYFLLAPKGFRKVLFVLRDYSQKRRETLGQYYVRTHGHLIPEDVEILEYDADKRVTKLL